MVCKPARTNPRLMLSAGDLRHRVTIQQRVLTDNGRGGRTTSHVDVATVWASIEPMRGEEFLDATTGAVTTVQKIKVRMRYRADITTSHRLKRADGVLLNIREVLDIEFRHQVLELICGEGGSDA